MRLSDAVVKYAWTWWSAPNVEDTAIPSSPPSPPGSTPGTDPSSVIFPPCAATRTIFPVSREATSRSPPGSTATPHGDFRPVARVPVTFTEPLAGGAVDDGVAPAEAPAPGLFAGAELAPPWGCAPPDEQPAARSSEAAANTAVWERRCTAGSSRRQGVDKNTTSRPRRAAPYRSRNHSHQP